MTILSGSARPRRQTLSSADRVLLVLSAFRDPRDELGVTDISSLLGIDKSVVHRILTALIRHHFLEQNEKTRKYRVGLRTWEIGRRFTVRHWVDQLAVPLLEELVQRTGGTGYVGMLDGSEVVYLATVDGAGPFRVHVEVGSRTWIHRTALGKAMLASLDEKERREKLEAIDLSTSRGKSVPPDQKRREIESELVATQSRGYSVNRGESRRGVGAVGAAVVDPRGRPIGAISVGFPMMDQYDQLWEQLPREVTRIASEISRRLG